MNPKPYAGTSLYAVRASPSAIAALAAFARKRGGGRHAAAADALSRALGLDLESVVTARLLVKVAERRGAFVEPSDAQARICVARLTDGLAALGLAPKC